MKSLPQLARYAWAAPYSALGLALGLLALAGGGAWQRHAGTVEFFGGRFGRALGALPQPLSFAAVTLGHVILAVDGAVLVELRAHERVHVRQYERWGPFFLPAYLASSVFQLLRGRDPYRENHFEREAYGRASCKRHPLRASRQG